jgi:hypothetical protein
VYTHQVHEHTRQLRPANRIGGTLSTTISPVPVTLTIGHDSGTAQMNARFN